MTRRASLTRRRRGSSSSSSAVDDDIVNDGQSGLDALFIAALKRAFAHAPVALAVTEGPAHTLRFANAPFQRLQSAGSVAIVAPPPPDGRPAANLAPLLDRAFQHVEIIRDELLGPTGSAGRWSCSVWPIADGTAAPDGLVVEVRDAAYVEGVRTRQRLIAERLLLGALREQDAATTAREVGERAVHLASTGRDLSMSLDEEETRDVVRRSRLTRRGTWCIVDLLEPNGAVHRLAVVHPDPAKQELARTLADRWYETRPGGPVHLARAAHPVGGKPQVITKDADAALVAVARGPEELETLRQLGFESLLVVPMVVQAKVMGVMTFVTAEGDAPLAAEDITLATDLADRCGMALDHARLYHEAEVLRLAAELASRGKSEFLARMSHELRTPLNSIGGFVEVLALETHGPLNAEQQTDLERIKRNQEHLSTLIEQVLTFVRAQGKRIEYELAAVPIRAILNEVAGMLERAAKEKGLELDLHSVDTGVAAWADPDRVRQILLNLVTNAIKYCPRGHGRITIASSVTPDAVMVHVTDLGPGIPADKLDMIFEPFVQLGGGLARREGGLGLGLSISRDLARAMHGDLTVESTVDVGSRFTLTLPRARHDPTGRGDPHESKTLAA
jgi:signal transduction histidine kinase